MEEFFPYEGWKDVKGYEGIYQISNLGRVKSLERKVVQRNGTIVCLKSKILKPTFNQSSTPIYVLSKDGVSKSYSVKRLLHENDFGYFYTFKYNKESANINGELSKKVLQISIDGTIVKEWPSMHECKRNGYNQGKISRCCQDSFRTHKNYYWRYA